MTDLHATCSFSAINAVIVDQPAANPRARKDTENRSRADRRAETVLAIDARIDIVAEEDRTTEFFLKQLLQRYIFPTEVGKFENHSFIEIERPWTANADPAQTIARNL